MAVLHIQVKPGASKDEILLKEDATVIIRIKEKPIKGAANEYLIRFLADSLNIRKSDISLEKGKSSAFKKLIIAIEQDELNARIQSYKR